jgi:hypothetical protein
MAFYKLVAGKHHVGWQTKIGDLSLKDLRDQLELHNIHFTEKDRKEKLVDLLQEEIGPILDTTRTYYKGDIIETKDDLCTKFNDPGNPNNTKFELVNEAGQAITQADPEVAPSVVHSDGLQSKTVHELKNLAEEEEIELSGATRKSQIIEIIRQARVTV